jgi:hypothetical protein
LAGKTEGQNIKIFVFCKTKSNEIWQKGFPNYQADNNKKLFLQIINLLAAKAVFQIFILLAAKAVFQIIKLLAAKAVFQIIKLLAPKAVFQIINQNAKKKSRGKRKV